MKAVYKILVVDDEPIHRRSLAEMIKELRPTYEVFEAKNGKEAIDFIKVIPMDIVITDIKMPIMDGLAFMESLGKALEKTKVIILSGFAYFEYAQKALRLGAFDFVLKPVNEEKVDEVIKKVEDKLKQEKIEIQERENIESRLKDTLPIYLRHLLNSWLDEELTPLKLKEIQKMLPLTGRGLVIVTQIYKYKELKKKYSNDEMNEIKLNIEFWIKEALNNIGSSTSFFLENVEENMVTILCPENNTANLQSAYLSKIKEFINNIKTSYEIDIAVGTGNEYEDIFNKVKNSYKEAELALQYKFFLEKEVVLYSEINKNLNKVYYVKNSDEDKLIEMIQNINKETAVKSIEEIFNNLLSKGYPSPVKMKEIASHLLLNIVKKIHALIQENEYSMLLETSSFSINECETYLQLKQIIYEFLNLIIDKIETNKNKKNEKIILKCKDYIETRYAEDITLDSVAEIFSFNSNYFSTFFKTNTGKSFSEYLIETRMNKAKELLVTKEIKVYEVAHMVGYRDVKYFNRAFKKQFGMSPDNFRRTSKHI